MVRVVARLQSRRDQRRGGHPTSGALAILGVDGDGPAEQTAGGGRGRQPHPGPAGGAAGPLAERVVPRGTEGRAPGGGPLLLTEGLQDPATALLPHVGPWRPPA